MNLILLFVALSLGQATPVTKKNGIVTSSSELATNAGVRILQLGGSAADAAVATALTLAVTRPYNTGLGGGGFAVVRFENKIQALNFRERAPGQANREMFIKKDPKLSLTGGLAAGVPGFIHGLGELHKKFGKLPWAKLVDDAINAAERGFEIDKEFADVLEENFKDFSGGPSKNFASTNKKPLSLGETCKQPELAKLLKILKREGPQIFYRGIIAKDIATSDKSAGGIITVEDLANYKSVWMDPLCHKVFSKFEICSMPPPSSGGLLMINSLRVLESLKIKSVSLLGSDYYHLLAETMSRSFSIRTQLGDPDFVKADWHRFLDENLIKSWVNSIDPKKKSEYRPNYSDKTDGHTTHFTVIDKDRNVVSMTITLNGEFGSGVFTEQFGVLLNNEMDDFTTQPGKPNLFGLIQGKTNEIEPGKIPLSSMSPTIMLKDGELFEALGSPGGPRIINATLQVALLSMISDFNIEEAVFAPRIHNQYAPDKVYFDRFLPHQIRQELEKKGHSLEARSIGKVYAIRVLSDGTLEGTNDLREMGKAGGY